MFNTGFPSDVANDGMGIAILQAARDLFAKYGYKKTTMEDIAHALRKGKSSLYYYFKNKEEIFQAVIGQERELLFGKLHEVTASKLGPKEKLTEYVVVRMRTIHQLDNYMLVVRDDSFEGYEFFDRLRGMGENEEAQMLMQIIQEGVDSGIFQVKNLEMAAVALAIAMKGLEGPLLKSSKNFDDFKVQIDNILNILFFGIIKR